MRFIWPEPLHVPIAETLPPIHRYDVEASLQAVMLKTIVQHEEFGTEGRERAQPDEGAIPPHQDRYTRGVGDQYHGLVAGEFGATVHVLAVGNHRDAFSPATAVTPARERDAVSAIVQRRRQPGCHRRLTTPANQHTSDAQDVARERRPRNKSSLVHGSV